MRSLILAVGLLLTRFCQAQVFTPPVYNPVYTPKYYGNGPYGAGPFSFEAGSYVLTASPTIRQQGELKMSKTDGLTVRSIDKQKQEYTTTEVSSFRIDKKRFVVEKNIKSNTSNRRKDLNQAFVALLDSGQHIVLMQLAYCLDGPSYVARRPQATEATMVDEKNLLPYLTDRPDLIKLYKAGYLSKNYIETDQLYIIAHSLNTGQPYVPPLSHYEIMKQQALAKRAKKAAAADSAKK